MSKYELVVVLSVEDKKLKEKVDVLIKEAGFLVAEEEDMGLKTLAYPIEGQESAKYFKLILEGEGSGVKKLEFSLTLEDGVLRYLTIALTPKLEKVRAEMAIVRAEIQAKAKKNEKLEQSSESKDKSERS
jgi:ribosomal protein S6